MTPQELTMKIEHGLSTLRSVSGLPSQLDLEPGALIEAALRIADLFADSKTIVDARMMAQANPQDTKAFLVAADKLQTTNAYRAAEFSSPSLAARNDIALAGLWLQGTIRDAGFGLVEFMQSLSTPLA